MYGIIVITHTHAHGGAATPHTNTVCGLWHAEPTPRRRRMVVAKQQQQQQQRKYRMKDGVGTRLQEGEVMLSMVWLFVGGAAATATCLCVW